MLAPAQAPEHRARLVRPGRLAEHVAVDRHHGVGPEHDARAHPRRHRPGLLERQPRHGLRQRPGGERFVHLARQDGEVEAEDA